jgi:alkanesulfonate monooxygenase SsuD/methylene tetrahydromethanopterin reductase-like flavin-dependent oxidoreductase (luciferase family)
VSGDDVSYYGSASPVADTRKDLPKIELGVHTGQQDIELDELRKLWRYCDDKGFDWISVWDHFYEAPNRDSAGPTYEAVSLMAALAVETTRPRLGCLVFCMNYRNPALLAKSLTTIDHLSGGRVTVGLGAGWHVQEHQAYGYDFPPVKERLDRLSEGVRIIRGMLTKERYSFEGKYYRVANIANNPRPLQERVPIIIGGGGEQRTLRIAAPGPIAGTCLHWRRCLRHRAKCPIGGVRKRAMIRASRGRKPTLPHVVEGPAA